MTGDRSYEWTFVVPDISGPDDERIDRLYAAADALVDSHSGLTRVSMLVDGQTAVAAAKKAIAKLENCGLVAERTYPEFVSRADIAERASKTRQAVDNWVRGDRQKDFPPPVHFVSGGVWLWRHVRDWLERERIQDVPVDETTYPSLDDHAVIDQQLSHAKQWAAAGERWGTLRHDIGWGQILRMHLKEERTAWETKRAVLAEIVDKSSMVTPVCKPWTDMSADLIKTGRHKVGAR